jgi:hypothetical protein
MLARIQRCARTTEDWLRYHPMVRGVLSHYQLWRGRALAARDPQAQVRALVKLCSAARLATSDQAVARIQARINARLGRLDAARVDWTEFVPYVDVPRLARGLVLKPYGGPREKGVLFVSFEREWFKLLWHADLAALADRYWLVVAPSSSPHNVMNYVFAHAYPGPLFSLLSNESDRLALPRISPRFVVVPLYASHWVNPQLFAPRPRAQRDIDLIMVASFGKVKRHHALFTALRAMPPELRILLVGQDQDNRDAATIRTEAGWFGVDRRIEVRSNATYEEVAHWLCRSRASVILSRREGSCVVVAESLFADTPVALLADAELGSRAFLNEATGRFLDEGDLAAQLTAFVRESDRYQPRAWADKNICCFRSSKLLNDTLASYARQAGQEWTTDIAPLCWRPDPTLVSPEDVRRLQAERREIQSRFGIEVGPYSS